MAAALLWKALLYASFIFALFSFILFYMYVHPKRSLTPLTPEDLGLAYESVELSAGDGVRLSAWFIPNRSSRKAVIACHGYPMDKGNILGTAAFLAEDFNLLLFDFRAMGGSGGFFSSGGVNETRDLAAAVGFLKGRGFDRLGLFGFSMGASAVLMYEGPDIAARVADSPFADIGEELDHALESLGILRRPLISMMKVWSLLLLGADMDRRSPVKAIAGLKTPVLLIHGDGDTQVPVAASLRLKEALPAAELWIIKGADHGGASGAPGYEARVAAFFNAALGS